MQRTVSLMLALSLVAGLCPQRAWAEETETPEETTTKTAAETISETLAETTAEAVPEATAETIPETTMETVPETVPVTESVSVETTSEAARQEPMLATAESGSCGNNVTWSLDSAGTLTISGTGPMADWSVFSSPPWNKNAASIKTVVIDSGVTNVGSYAFKSCTSLSYVILSNSVTEIKSNAFLNCKKLTDIVLPEQLSVLGAYAFENSGIISIELPNSLTSIGNSVFDGCTSLMSIRLPDNLTGIPASFFMDCSSLTGITLPESVTSIGSWAFYGCTSLTNVVLPDNITILEDNLFNGCTSLSSIKLPKNATAINSKAFYKCTVLNSITLPQSLTSIGTDAFQMCNALKEVYYSGTEEEWTALLDAAENGNYPLSDSSLIVHFNYPGYVKNSGICGDELTWNYNINTATLTISGTGDMYDYTAGTAPWYADFGDKISTLVIEEGATSIGSFAFYRCRSLENVTIADTVTAIGSDAFYYCGSLEKITLPVSITHIGDRAFSACTGLTNFNVPTRTTTIGSQAFAYTNLKTITIPGTVTFLGQDAFLESTALTDVYFDGYLTEWEALGITLEKGVSLHYKLTVMQQKWVDAHMDYIFSDAYQTDIISGYDSWMLKIFQKAQDDGGVAAYDLAKGLSEDLDFELDGVETYEVLLSMILSDRSVMNAYCDTYFESYCDSIAVTGKTLKDIGSSKNLPKDVAETIESAYKTLTESEEGSNAFFDAYETLVEQFDKHFTTEEMKAGLKKQRYMEALGLGIEGLFAAYGNLQDVLRYTENYRAYLYTSRYFKQALQTMGALANYHANSAAGPFAYNPFNDLGYWESQLNWGEFQTALNHFIEALDAYETEGAKAVAAKRVEELGETGEDILKIVGKFGLEKLLSTIPVVNGLMVAKGVLSVGVLCAEIASNVDDRKLALDMMTKAYCLSVLMDKSIESCADAMDYDALDISMVFDESVQIYVSNQNLGLDYAIKYAELRLKNAITDYRYYRITHDEVSEKKLNELKREINIFTGYIELLNMQRGRIRKIACHDPHLTYVPETDAVVSDFLDARAFVVACPVSVTVTDPRGKQMALLTDNGSQVAEGYELYFHTIPLNDGSGQHIKVAIAPKDYTVTVEGTDEGEMNAFVKDYADVSNTVSMYLDVPVKKGSKGSFRNVAQKQEPVLTMDDTNHEPIVSGPQPGDVNLDGDVTTDDAEYLLWHTLFPDLYPITADADFNNDGIRNTDDAVKLLWHAMFPEQYPLT